jgi:hypothetical protein
MMKRGTMPKDTNPRAAPIATQTTDEDDDSTSQMLRIWSKDWDSDEDQSNRVGKAKVSQTDQLPSSP